MSLFGTRRHAPLPAEGYLPGFEAYVFAFG
jgi:hypothetical protein